MSTFDADNAVRSFDNDVAPLFKGFSVSAFAPIILVAFIIFFIVKIFFASYSDSGYRPYAKSLALTAANLWDNREELGLSPSVRGRSLSSLEPLTEVLNALSDTIRKYELDSSANTVKNSSSKMRFE